MATTIKLTRPINHGGKTYETVEVDEPTLGGIEAFEKASRDGGDVAAMVAMLSVDLGWPIEAVRKIRASELQKISDALGPFVEALKPKDQRTGVH